MTKIRQAILKAADSIEQNPGLFHFGSTRIPNPGCGSPGCALGWIGHHLGMSAGKGLYDKDNFLYKSLGIKEDCCFERLTKTVGSYNWKFCPTKCAKALRLYADKYHPETDRIPESIRALFDQEAIAQ